MKNFLLHIITPSLLVTTALLCADILNDSHINFLKCLAIGAFATTYTTLVRRTR